MAEYRLEWFKERVLTLLEEVDDAFFTDLLIKDDGQIRDQLVNFINSDINELSGKEKRVVFFYKTYQRKLIEPRDAVVAKGNQLNASLAPKDADLSSDEDGHDSSEYSGSKSPPASRTPMLSAGKSSSKGSAKKGRGSVQRTSVSSDSKSAKKSITGSAKSAKKGRRSPSTVVESLTDDVDDRLGQSGSPDTGGDSSPEPSGLEKKEEMVELKAELNCKFGSLSESDLEKLGERQAAFFARISHQGVASVDSWDKAAQSMPNYFVVASFAGSALDAFSIVLENILAPIYYPENKSQLAMVQRSSSLDAVMALSMTQSINFETGEAKSAKGGKNLNAAQVFENIKQLTASLLQYNKSLIKFHLDDEELEVVKKVLAGEDAANFKDAFEAIFSRWIPQVLGHLDDILKKNPADESPMAEVECWEEKEISLSGLNCSLQKSNVVQVCLFAKKIDLQSAKEFQQVIFRVETLLIESREIVRSFAPLINYFQELSACDCLTDAGQVLAKLIDGLRLLWVLCSPYNKDERMQALLQRVAWQICTKVADILNMGALFKEGAENAKCQSIEATKLLKSWKELYFQTRRAIEKAGHTARWEFDVRKLFGHSEYIREVCVDLTEICDVLIQFRAVLNLRLEAVIRNQTMMNMLSKQVALLIAPIQQDADFEVFVAANADSWRSFMNHFRKNVLALEQDVCKFLNESISRGNLSSALDALGMLETFHAAETRAAIKSVIDSKFEVVIRELLEEIVEAKRTFLNDKDVPPLLRDQPRDAGAIFWCRGLFNRLKRSVVQFKKCDHVQQSAALKEAFTQYVQLVRHMKVYQDDVFHNWNTKAEKIINVAMSSHLIRVIKKRDEKQQSTTAVERRLGSLFASSDGGGQSTSEASSRMMLRPVLASLRWVARAVAARKRASMASESNLVLPHIGLEPSDASVPSLGMQYEVGITDEFFMILTEAQMMEQMGLEIGPLIINTVVQKEEMEAAARNLRDSVRKLNEMLAPLDVAEVSLLQFALKRLERVIEPGIYRLKWTSQSVRDYCEDFEEAVNTFSASVGLLKLCSAKAQKQTDLVQSHNLFYVEGIERVAPWQYFFERCASSRRANVQEMVQAYQTLSKVLIDLEYLMDKTHTGRKDCMRKYYLHWEQLFFEALLQSMVASIDHFAKIVSGDVVFLKIDARLDGSSLSLNPTPTDALEALNASAKEVVLSAKHFRRWMDGTCLWCPDASATEPKSGQLHATKEFSFLEDVAKIDFIKERHAALKCVAEELLLQVQKELAKWEKYCALWQEDKKRVCQAFSAENPSIVKYDEKLAEYSEIEAQMELAARFVDIGCIRLNLEPLMSKITAHAVEWKWHLAQGVIAASKKEMKTYLWSMWGLQADVDQVVEDDDLDTLKEVLQAIVKIRNCNTDREVHAFFIQENYRTMKAHKIKVDEGDAAMSNELWPMWEDLYEMSKKKAKKLAAMHAKYSEMTIGAGEQFQQKCVDLEVRFSTSGPGCVGDDLSRGLLLLEEYKRELQILECEKDRLSDDEMLFDVPLSDHSKLCAIQTQMLLLQEIFDLFALLKSSKDKWSSTLWVDLSAGALSEGIKQFDDRFEHISVEAQLLAVAAQLKSEIDGFKSTVPLFEALKCDALRDRHWRSLMDGTDKSFDVAPESLRLQNLFDMQLHLHEAMTYRILQQAQEELKIENLLIGMRKTWQLQDFRVEKFQLDGHEHGLILGTFDEALDHLSEHQAQLQLLLNSEFVGPFLETVHFWELKLSVIEESVQLWMGVKEKWLNLEVLFCNKELHVHLPSGSLRKFDACRKTYHKMIKEIAKNPQVVAACCRHGNIGDLRNLLHLLEESQAAFDDYLFSKRQIFPRLYFTSDEELIQILASQIPDCLRAILKKRSLFPSISKIAVKENMDGEGYLITGFSSLEDEFVEFKKPLKTEDSEKINLLSLLNDKIKSAVTLIVDDSIQSFLKGENSVGEIVSRCPANLCLPGLQTLWTRGVEQRLRKIGRDDIKAMRRYLDEINADIEGIAAMLQTRGDALQKAKLTFAFIAIAHFKEIVERLTYASVADKSDFLWENQLRFYWGPDDGLTVQQAFSDLTYGYEFNGMDHKLICTPETDKVKLVITQSLRLQLGVLICGQCGVGKTAIVRDLARTLGRRVVCFDCTPSTPWGSVARVLSGVAQSGFWGCLKQFNLLAPSSLSIISAQLQTLKAALAMGLRSFNFNSTEVRLDPAMAVLATVRPGQVGRTELPLTLTALFRPAACAPPDLNLIARVRLQAMGFSNYKKLARKVTKFCELCGDKLSRQRHYSFGLIQMNSVFNILQRPSDDDADEERALFRALRSGIAFKLQAEDQIMFAELIKDVFPQMTEIAELDSGSEWVGECLQRAAYQTIERQKSQISHLLEVLASGRAALLVGDSGGGKSVIIEICLERLKQQHKDLKQIFLSPKSCGIDEFFGSVRNGKLVNGVFSKLLTEACAQNRRTVFVFDSQIDPVWIENVSSVLDENCCLTMFNADRQKYEPSLVSFIFETGNLQTASPAILPRAAVLHVGVADENYRALWASLRERKFAKISERIQQLFKQFVPALFDVVAACQLKTIVPFSKVNSINQLGDMLGILLSDKEEHLTPCFVQALYLSIGSTLLEQEHDVFDANVKTLANMVIVDDDSPQNPARMGQLPARNIFDYAWDEEKECWMNWQWVSAATSALAKVSSLEETLIPTPMTRFYQWLLSKHVESNFKELVFKKIKRPVVLIGEEGCSKTLMAQSLLATLDSTDYLHQSYSLSLQTKASDIRAVIRGTMQNRTKNILEPLGNKKLVIFLDDLNMPLADAFGSQETIEFLRFLLQHGGFYNEGSDFNWTKLEHTGFIGSITADEFTQSKLDPRFLSKLNAVHIPKLSDALLHQIYSKILVDHLQNFAAEVQQLAENLVSATLHLFKILNRSLPPTPARWMCQLGVRDLTRLFGGLCQTQPQNFSKPETLVRVWRHEIYRVFADRLESDEDQVMIQNLVQESIKEYFEPYVDHTLRNPVLFGDFRNALTHNTDQRYYEDLLDFEAVFFLFQEVLEELNTKRVGPKLEVVLFDSALEHLSRLHRVLRMRRGHSVLVGSPGSGRKSLFSLAASAAQCQPFRLPFAASCVADVVREMYEYIGLEKKSAALYVIDADLKQEGVSEILYHMMTTGWAPGIFNKAAKMRILQRLRNAGGGVNAERDDEKLWMNFCSDCVSRLHVVMSLERETLYALTQEYPEFLTFTMLDWYQPWNEFALRKVAKNFISNNSLVLDTEKDVVISHIIQSHVATQETYAKSHTKNINCSPRLFTDFIQLFLTLLESNLQENKTQINKLNIAVNKIAVANNSITNLAKQLSEKSEQLKKSEEDLAKINKEISEVTEEKDKQAELSVEWDRGIERQVRILASDRIQVQRIIDCALPELNVARESLKSISKSDLESIRDCITLPMDNLRALCESMLMLKGISPPDTDNLIAKFTNLEEVRDFAEIKCESISHTVCRKVKVRIKQRGGNLDELYELCAVAKIFTAFISTVLQYCNVLREVKPKLELIANVEDELVQSRKKSEQLLESIKQIEEKQRNLVAQKLKMEEEVHIASKQSDEIQTHLLKMTALFASLQNEEQSLKLEMSSLELKSTKLLGDCLLVAAFVSYGGPLSPLGDRQSLIDGWMRSLQSHNIPFSNYFNPHQFLSTQTLTETFVEICDLDSATMQNLLLVFRSVRAPLCIDPQQQVASWIKLVEKDLILASAFDCDLVEKIESAAIAGHPVLLQDLSHSISSALFDILDKVIIAKDDGDYVKVGDNLIKLSANFRIYFNTREANPSLDPVVFSKTTVIDCTMTAQALQDLLIKDVIKTQDGAHYQRQERLRVRGREVLRSQTQFKNALIECLVEASEEHLLQNQPFLRSLQDTKLLIEKSGADAEQIRAEEATFNQVQSEFGEIAQRSAILFSVLADLAHMGPTYLFSLTTFRELMTSSITEATAKCSAEPFSDVVCKIVTMNVHSFACRSLFAEHQLPFTLAMILRIKLSKAEVSPEEVKYLICFESPADREISQQESPHWINRETYKAAVELRESFPSLFANFLEDIKGDEWKKWVKLAVPEKKELPMKYSERLTEFQVLLVVKTLRRDRVIPAILNYICDNFGQHFITPIIPSMRSLLNESTCKVPILFTVSGGGVDPSTELQRLSKQMGLDHGQFVSLALGKGSEKSAMAALQNAIRRGQWLVLLNCHLVPNLPALVWCYLDQSAPHQDFRLWITTDKTAILPPILLHHALKVVLETPKGLKLKLNSTFRKIDPDVMSRNKHSDFGKILYALAHFHATIQERGEFANIGWNNKYHFTKPDFDACAFFLGKFLANVRERKVPWESIQKFMEQVVYGAHMTDDYDSRVIVTYLQEFCGAFIFNSKFYFYRDDNTSYGLPSIQNLFGILAYIQNLPLNYSPGVLGLHSNADVVINKRCLVELIANLMKMQPQPVEMRNALANQNALLEAVERIKQLVPESLDVNEIKMPKHMSASEHFIVQEVRGFNKQLAVVLESLNSLEKALKGMGKMTKEMKALQSSIINDDIPDDWRQWCPPTNKKLSPWLRQLQKRFQQYYDWVMKYEPLIAWLPGLANPRSYLLTVLQTACRKYHWPIEQAGLVAQITNAKHLPAPKDGIYVKGIYLENAGWDGERRCLKSAEVCSLSVALPVVQITASQCAAEPPANCVRLPLYVTVAHTEQLVWQLDLPCDQHPSNWLLQGARLVLNPD